MAVSSLALALVLGTRAAWGVPSKAECIAASESGQELRHGGKLRDARERFALCVSEGCPGPVRADCADRLAEVDKAMPTLVVAAVDQEGTDLSEVRVLEDGAQVVARLDGTPVRIDPGDHAFRFETAGYLPVTRRLVAREMEKGRRLAIQFKTVATSTAEAADDSAGPVREGEPPPRWPSYLAFGVAGVGLIAGAVFTVAWASENGKCSTLSRDACLSAHSDHESVLGADTVGAVSGFGLAVVAAGVGWWLWPSASAGEGAHALEVRPRLGLGWLGVDGRFR